MLRRRTFAQAFAFLCVFWIVGEILLGFNRTPMADTFTGNVYFYTQINGVKKLEPLNAQVKVDVIDLGYIYDRVRSLSGPGLRIKFTGDTSLLKQYGIDPGLMREDSQGGICEVKQSNSRTQAPMFVTGVMTEHAGLESYYASVHHMTFFKIQDDDIDCKKIHLGILNSNDVQIALDGLNANGFVFADLTRDSHISFIQRMVMMLRPNQEGLLAKFLAKS